MKEKLLREKCSKQVSEPKEWSQTLEALESLGEQTESLVENVSGRQMAGAEGDGHRWVASGRGLSPAIGG